MKEYVAPLTEVICYETESVMLSVSSNANLNLGGYGSYDPR